MTKIQAVDVLTSDCISGNGVRDRFLITADTPRGEVYILRHAFEDEDQAERIATKIRIVGKINLEHWDFWRTIYGTEAFEAEEAEASVWAQAIRGGFASEADAPSNIRTLL